MAGDHHESLVSDLLRADPRIKVKGFVANLVHAIGPDVDSLEWSRSGWVMPDAYLIDTGTDTVTVFEVEVFNYVSARKKARYTSLWLDLDCLSWDLILKVVDRFGGQHEEDLPIVPYVEAIPHHDGLHIKPFFEGHDEGMERLSADISQHWRRQYGIEEPATQRHNLTPPLLETEAASSRVDFGGNADRKRITNPVYSPRFQDGGSP